jgi:hypothetical protein
LDGFGIVNLGIAYFSRSLFILIRRNRQWQAEIGIKRIPRGLRFRSIAAQNLTRETAGPMSHSGPRTSAGNLRTAD